MRLPKWLLLCCSIVLCLQLGCENDDGPDAGGGGEAGGAVDPSQPVQPLDRHPHVELSNLQFGKSFNDRETFSVDWTMPPEGNMSQFTLIVKPTDGPNRMELTDWFNGTSGTMSGQVQTFGFGDGGSSLASGCEVYLVSKEGDLEFKVSNSLTAGNAAVTEARPATEAELAKVKQDLNAPPPEAAGFVAIPDGITLPKDTPVKVKVGPSLVDGTVIEHTPETGIIRAYRLDAKMRTIGQAADFLIDPQVLEGLTQ